MALPKLRSEDFLFFGIYIVSLGYALFEFYRFGEGKKRLPLQQSSPPLTLNLHWKYISSAKDYWKHLFFYGWVEFFESKTNARWWRWDRELYSNKLSLDYWALRLQWNSTISFAKGVFYFIIFVLSSKTVIYRERNFFLMIFSESHWCMQLSECYMYATTSK